MAEEKKKRGFLKKVFGLKSKDEKLAEEAAERAERQKLVDEQMAARMAAINAAALKSARMQDEQAGLIDPEEEARIEEEERKKAEAQAQKDVERAKQLAEEKRAAEAAREAELEAEKLAREQEAAEKKALEQKQKEEARQKKQKASRKDEAKAKAKTAPEPKPEPKPQPKPEPELKTKPTADEASSRPEPAKVDAPEHAPDLVHAAKLAPETPAEPSPAKAPPSAEPLSPEPAGKAPAKEPGEKRRLGFLGRISSGLRKSTSRMSEGVSAIFTKRKLDDEAIAELEDLLIASDFGVGPATKVTQLLAKDRFDKQVTDMEVKIALADVISDILTPLEQPLELTGAKPEIILFVGVNGSGKTTTLGKIAKKYTDAGKKVLIVAGDTFRAAAVEQLSIWGERAGAPVVSGKVGADAAGLVYDAIEKAKAEDYDIVLIDTAGRLQNRTELMDELAKIVRVIQKHDPSAPHHTILVLDATVGQNALSQTEAFKNIAGVSGLIMTKLDGTAKGGVLVALSDKYKLPIHYIGIGEKIDDLENFSAPVFAAALSGVADSLQPEAAA